MVLRLAEITANVEQVQLISDQYEPVPIYSSSRPLPKEDKTVIEDITDEILRSLESRYIENSVQLELAIGEFVQSAYQYGQENPTPLLELYLSRNCDRIIMIAATDGKNYLPQLEKTKSTLLKHGGKSSLSDDSYFTKGNSGGLKLVLQTADNIGFIINYKSPLHPDINPMEYTSFFEMHVMTMPSLIK
ncbi:MAG: hypothetical protein NDI94_06615 [Candidatus Woesearchaeota archaeon]|nr:hypothetical protein [Candidatus Woesearchaeota archaeon]